MLKAFYFDFELYSKALKYKFNKYNLYCAFNEIV